MSTMHPPLGALERQIIDRRDALLGFIRSRVGDDELAEDILQTSLLRALQAAPEFDDEDRLVPWLYRIIRNAITDSYRRHAAAARRLERYVLEQPTEEMPEEDHAALCACFRSVLPTMKPEYADRPGDWALHCHMTHHIMNQMRHDLPNMTGVEPGTLDGYDDLGRDGIAL